MKLLNVITYFEHQYLHIFEYVMNLKYLHAKYDLLYDIIIID